MNVDYLEEINFFLLQILDEIFPDEDGNYQSQYERQGGTERDVLKNPGSVITAFMKPRKQIIQHNLLTYLMLKKFFISSVSSK